MKFGVTVKGPTERVDDIAKRFNITKEQAVDVIAKYKPGNAEELKAAGVYYPISVKPQPPADLWEKLEALQAECGARAPNSFTVQEYAQRFNIQRSSANQRLLKLVKAGKLRAAGRGRNNAVYYQIVEEK